MVKKNNNELFLQIILHKLKKAKNELIGNKLYLTKENITTRKLGEIINKAENELIGFFWEEKYDIKPNQTLPFNFIKDYCKSIGIEVIKKSEIDFREIIEEYIEKRDSELNFVKRPAIVSLMGHINHGKTTLLDTIVSYFSDKHKNMQNQEAGGITQKITAHPIEFKEQKIIFLDTPGHGDFIKMRERGVSLTDLVILIIDAKEGIMNQTEEIIKYLHEYKLPTIVFINHKKSKETNNEKNLNRIKFQLQEIGLTPLEEGWDGKTIIISGNAREKEEVINLLENISLFADQKANSKGESHGIIIDSYLDLKTNIKFNKLLVKGGELKTKDTIFLNGELNSIKIMCDVFGKRINLAYVGDIVQVSNLSPTAELGDKFIVIEEKSQQEIIEKELTNYLVEKKQLITASSLISSKKNNFKIILLADSQNSLVALVDLVRRLDNDEFSFLIIGTAVGILSDSTINLAKIDQAYILSFGFLLSSNQITRLKNNKIKLVMSNIIYEIAGELEKIINSKKKTDEIFSEKNAVGRALVKIVIHSSKIGSIAGCQVMNGKINRNHNIKLFRKGKEILTNGKIKSLEEKNEKKNEVISGRECGIVLKDFNNFEEGDEIFSFE